jgi:hypothetical protein
MHEKVGRIAHDGEAGTLDETPPVRVRKGRQVRPSAGFPVDLGDRVAAILQETSAGVEVAGGHRAGTRAVVERIRVGIAAIGDVDQERAVARTGIGQDEKDDAGPVGDSAGGIARRLVEVGNAALVGREFPGDAPVETDVIAGPERAVGLPARDLKPRDLGVRGASAHRDDEQGGGARKASHDVPSSGAAWPNRPRLTSGPALDARGFDRRKRLRKGTGPATAPEGSRRAGRPPDPGG